MAIRMGLRHDDYDQAAKIIKPPQRTKFDPNEKKSDNQKNIDSLLFGPPKKKNTNQPPKNQKPANQDILKSKQVPKTLPPVIPKIEVKKTDSIILVSKVQDGPVIGQRPNQPQQHRNPQIYPIQRISLEIQGIFNRPSYIRKLKKIAQDFDYKVQNSSKHSYTDILRPIECDRHMMSKFRSPNFKDVEFPTVNTVLSKNQKQLEDVDWQKHHGRSACFGKYIDPNDIRPGQMSAPQLLSVMSCLAEKQQNIKRLIEDQKQSQDGFYLIRLNINSVWRYIFVDDMIPFYNHQPLCAASFPDNEIEGWVTLLQKAYAKAYGFSYDIFSKPTPHQHYLRDLTGAPVQIFAGNDQHLFDAVKQALERGYPVMAVPTENVVKLGANPNYCFNVVSSSKGSLGMRNSWGTIEQKNSLNMNKQGVFEMSARQIAQNINQVLICQVRQHYYTSTLQTKHKKGFFSTYSFILEDHVDGFLSVSQIDQRIFPSQANYKYSPLRFILEKKSVEGGAVLINAAYNHHSRNVDLQVSLSPGQYYIHVIADWVGKQYDLFLTFYGGVKIEFNKLYTRQFPKMLTQSLDKECVEKGTMSSKGAINQYTLYHEDSNLIIITAENTGDQTNHTLDLSKVTFDHLTLINGRNDNEHFQGKTGQQLQVIKNDAGKNRRWNVRIPGGSKYTWVISTNESYSADNLKKYKF